MAGRLKKKIKSIFRSSKSSRSKHRYDYLSPSLTRANLLSRFPSLIERDPTEINWPYMRSHVPHIFRTDTRSKKFPDAGVLSVEEAELLFNNARSFSKKRGIEIGCHFAWSTAHLLAADLNLDVIDPALADPYQFREVEKSLSAAKSDKSAHLWAGFSPNILPAVLATQAPLYSFAFIDGEHEGDGPLNDCRSLEGLMTENSVVMFHDLVHPSVAKGLEYFAAKGWNIGIYNTMQVMGIAWRGLAEPVGHKIDPNMPGVTGHLTKFKMLSN